MSPVFLLKNTKINFKNLQTIRKKMKKSGRLYLTVPSYPFLWSAEDVLANHFRRYSLKQITNVIKSAGFKIEFSTYIFRFFPFPIFLFRVLPYRMRLSERKKSISSNIENLFKKRNMRFGSSCLIVARKL